MSPFLWIVYGVFHIACMFVVTSMAGYYCAENKRDFWDDPIPFLFVLVAPVTIIIGLIALAFQSTYDDGYKKGKLH